MRFDGVFLKAFVLSVTALLVAAGSASAGGWHPTQSMPITPTDIGFDADGNAIAIGFGDNVAGGPGRTIATTLRPAGGEWSERSEIPEASSGVSGTNWNPRIAVNSNGDAVATWGEQHGDIFVAVRPADGDWTEAEQISEKSVTFADHHVVIDEQGNATAIWSEFDRTEPLGDVYVVRSSRRPHDGEWSDPETLSDSENNNAKGSVLAIDASGNVTALWIGKPEDPGELGVLAQAVKSRYLPAGAAEWSESVEISTGLSMSSTRIAADSAGRVAAVWVEDALPAPGVIRAAYRDPGQHGDWSEAQTLGDGHAPEVAIDDEGNAAAVWIFSNAVKSSERPAGGDWSEPVDLPTPPNDGTIQRPGIAFDAEGIATAIWGRIGGDAALAESARRVPGQDWMPEDSLELPGLNRVPAGGMDPQGHATLVWSGNPPLEPPLGLSNVFDFVGPELRDLSVPSSVVVGTPVSVSVTPFDIWSQVATTEWSFGDGSDPVAGDSAQHTYQATGKYTVTITGTDALDNATTETREITVQPVSSDGNGDGPDQPPGPGRPPPPLPPSTTPSPSAECVEARQFQLRLTRHVRQVHRRVVVLHRRAVRAKSARRAVRLRTAKRRWRIVLKKRRAALRRAALRTNRLCP